MIFSILLQLNFNVQYANNNASFQDYFIFTGQNNSAHLFRNDSTIMLVYTHGSEYMRYQCPFNDTMLLFKWPLTVNNEPMMMVEGDKRLHDPWEFSSFLFLDPLLINEEEEVSGAQEELPYDILIGVLTIFVLITKLPDIVAAIKARMKKLVSYEITV